MYRGGGASQHPDGMSHRGSTDSPNSTDIISHALLFELKTPLSTKSGALAMELLSKRPTKDEEGYFPLGKQCIGTGQGFNAIKHDEGE